MLVVGERKIAFQDFQDRDGEWRRREYSGEGTCLGQPTQVQSLAYTVSSKHCQLPEHTGFGLDPSYHFPKGIQEEGQEIWVAPKLKLGPCVSDLRCGAGNRRRGLGGRRSSRAGT